MSSAPNGLPPRPERPVPRPPARGGNWLGLMLAGTLGMAALMAMMMLLGAFLGVALVLGVGLFAMHYLIWGKWIANSITPAERAEAQRELDAAGPQPTLPDPQSSERE